VFDLHQPGVALIGHDSPEALPFGRGRPGTHRVFFPLMTGSKGTPVLRIMRRRVPEVDQPGCVGLLSRTLRVMTVFIAAACAGSPQGMSVPFREVRLASASTTCGTRPRCIACSRLPAVPEQSPWWTRIRSRPDDRGFSASSTYDGSHDFGPTSVDEGNGFLFVTDRSSQKLNVVDPTAGTVVTSLTLSASPDYARFVAATNEVWISEPASSQIESSPSRRAPRQASPR